MKISVVVPVFNEEGTVVPVLTKLEQSFPESIERETIVVNDGSTDGTLDTLNRHRHLFDYLISHPARLGKGAALKTALQRASGDYIVIQDADLEYDPADLQKLFAALGHRPVIVLGYRRFVSKPAFRLVYDFGNRLTTFLFNLKHRAGFKDCNTCYKLFPAFLAPNLAEYRENDFVFDCVRLNEEFVKSGLEIKQVPISYRPRRKGKKLTLKDGFKIIRAILHL